MMHNGFAQLGEFERRSEDYDFNAFIHLNSESVLVGQEAQILIRPKLTINNRKASVKMLKNIVITVKTKDFIKQSVTSKQFSGLKFLDDQDKIVQFQIPPNLQEIKVEITCDINNATRSKTESFSRSACFSIKEHSKNKNRFRELYLRRVADEYVVLLLGRNGEPNAYNQIEVTLKHQDYSHEVHETMTTDKHGQVGLGQLQGVETVQARLKDDSSVSDAWSVASHSIDSWTQPYDIHIIEGEEVEIPVSFDQERPLAHQASLLMYRDDKLISNLFERISFSPSKHGLYRVLKLQGLETGEYQLKLNLNAGQRQSIKITVHEGQHWEGNFILKKNNLFESSSMKKSVRVEQIVKLPSSTENELDVQLQLSHVTKETRVHIVAAQFMPQSATSLRDELERYTQDKIAMTNFLLARWKNMYESDHKIGDEIRYVFDRQHRRNQMGNTLDRPTLLMKRNFLKYTSTDNENLQAGTSYQKRDLGRNEVAARAQAKASSQVKYKSSAPISNKIKDFQNFLSSAPIQLFNLKPNEDGQVAFKLAEPHNYTQLIIIAVDTDSSVQKMVSIQKLAEVDAFPEIPLRDLTINSDQPDDPETGLIDKRATSCLQSGGKVHIRDITSSQIQIIDTLDKVVKVVEAMKTANSNSDFHQSEDNLYSEMVSDVLLKWVGMDRKEKISKYSKYVCHELNFFIFKKDRDFFDGVVRYYVQNKMEKTFIDWYLLAHSTKENGMFLERILGYLESLGAMNSVLNTLEICLVVETALKFGNEHQKQRASAMARQLVGQHQKKEVETPYFSNKNQRTKILDIVLSISDLEQARHFEQENSDDDDEEIAESNSDHSDSPDEFHELFGFGSMQEMQWQGSREQSLFRQEQQMYQMQAIQSNQMNMMQMDMCLQSKSCKEAPQKKMKKQFFGGAALKCASKAQKIMPMSQQIMPMQQQIMPMQQQMMPMQQQIMHMADCMPEENCLQAQFSGFGNYEEIQEQRHQVINDIGFQELDKTCEYMETHYYKKKSAGSHPQFFSHNRLFKDYLSHLLLNNSQPFLSDSFIDISSRFLPVAMSLLDLPFECQQVDGKPLDLMHKYKSDKKRGIYITAVANAVVFKKEIKEDKCQLRKEVIITHRYQNLMDSQKDVDSSEFIINNPYQCEVIMTNISSRHQKPNVLFQVPYGSLPLGDSKYIDSQQVSISPFTTTKVTFAFYFPSDGKFLHHPSNISEKKVSAKSPSLVLEVRKRRIITKVETFVDIMLTTPTKDERKAKILELMRTRPNMLPADSEFKFDISCLYGLTWSDCNFFVDVTKILYQKVIFDKSILGQIFQHLKEILTADRFKDDRQFFTSLLKGYLAHEFGGSKLTQYCLRPFDSLILELTPDKFFHHQNIHLEYFPMVNQRVFAIGAANDATDDGSGGLDDPQEAAGGESGPKQILNKDFRNTYIRFIHLAVHSARANGALNLAESQKLQLAYFLQLQDRIEEAITVYKAVNLGKLQQTENTNTCQVVYDYMTAYFEFFIQERSAQDGNRFSKVREIVDKYKDFPIGHFNDMFKKVREQLEEIDYSHQQAMAHQENKDQILADQEEEVSEEQKRLARLASSRKVPIIHSVAIDQISGELTIDLQNIKSLKVKYYKIDAEILFSRSPFVKDEAKHFSYVKPFEQVDKALEDEVTEVRIPLPESMKKKNMVIEVCSEDKQQFLTYYQSELKVQVNEKYGELRVFNRSTEVALAKVYVKVFSKNKSGSELFFRDGFTDIRGKFEYANASGKSVKDIAKFSILVSDDETGLGQMIKEVDPPKK